MVSPSSEGSGIIASILLSGWIGFLTAGHVKIVTSLVDQEKKRKKIVVYKLARLISIVSKPIIIVVVVVIIDVVFVKNKFWLKKSMSKKL